MSLLSSPQATPERVLALLRLLEALKGEAATADVVDWMNPQAVPGRERGSAVKATITAAKGLSFIDVASETIRLTDAVPTDLGSFADAVHARLVNCGSDNPDGALLFALASLVVEYDRDFLKTLQLRTSEDFAGRIRELLKQASVPDETAYTFNQTQLAPWIRWMVFAGLGHDATGLTPFQPHVSLRLARVLESFGVQHGFDRAHPAPIVWTFVQRQMPYLDGGTVYQVFAKNRNTELTELSFVSSSALLDLADRGVLEMQMLGDSRHRVMLSEKVRDIAALPGVDLLTIRRRPRQ